jgi:hypothetical protein
LNKTGFFAELEATEEVEEEEGHDGEVVKQQEHDHKLGLEISELYTDVEVEFFEARMR